MEQLTAGALNSLKCIYYSNIVYQITSEEYGVNCKDVTDILKATRRYISILEYKCALTNSIICEINEFLRFELMSNVYKCYEENLCLPNELITKDCDLTIVVIQNPMPDCSTPIINIIQ